MNSKTKQLGSWALPPKNNNATSRPLTGRVIFGMLTGNESPEATNLEHEIITSAKRR